MKKKIFAFSLVEMLMALLVASLLLVALAPVITKKYNETVSIKGLGDRMQEMTYTLSYNDEYCSTLDDTNGVCTGEFPIPSNVAGSMYVTVIGAGGGGAAAASTGSVEFTTKGTHSFVVPQGVYEIDLTMIGGGSGGYGGAAVEKNQVYVVSNLGGITSATNQTITPLSSGTGSFSLTIPHPVLITACGGGGGGGGNPGSGRNCAGYPGFTSSGAGGRGGYILNNYVNVTSTSAIGVILGGGGGGGSMATTDTAVGGTGVFGGGGGGGGDNWSSGGGYGGYGGKSGGGGRGTRGTSTCHGLGGERGDTSTGSGCTDGNNGKVNETVDGGTGASSGGTGSGSSAWSAAGGGGGSLSGYGAGGGGGGGGGATYSTQAAGRGFPGGGGGGGGGEGGGNGGNGGIAHNTGTKTNATAGGMGEGASSSTVFGSKYCGGGAGLASGNSSSQCPVTGGNGQNGAMRITYLAPTTGGVGGGAGKLVSQTVKVKPGQLIKITVGKGGDGGAPPYIGKTGTTTLTTVSYDKGSIFTATDPTKGEATVFKKYKEDNTTVEETITTGESNLTGGGATSTYAGGAGGQSPVASLRTTCSASGGTGTADDKKNGESVENSFGGCGGGGGYSLVGNGGKGSQGYAKITWNAAKKGTGGGGASGYYIEKRMIQITPGSSIPFQIGKGGEGGKIEDGEVVMAQKGGDTIFGTGSTPDTNFKVTAGGGYGGMFPMLNATNTVENGKGGFMANLCRVGTKDLLICSESFAGNDGTDTKGGAGANSKYGEGGAGGAYNANGKAPEEDAFGAGGGGAGVFNAGTVSEGGEGKNDSEGAKGADGQIILLWYMK